MAELTRRKTRFSDELLLLDRIRVAVEAIDPAIRTEIFRKSLHMLIALVPALAAYLGAGATLTILAGGTLFYTLAETGRQHGHPVFLIGRLTVLSTRDRDRGRFVLGPVTLGLGAMIALFLYPAPVAAIAIYALAFGDGLASLVGKVAGRRTLFGTSKTVEGSLTCFAAVFAASAQFVSRPEQAFLIALGATVIEALPSDDFDNLLLPIGTGVVASAVLLM